ncbi:MAG: amidohydrolase [Candidatus Limnocylindrales bacterium]
MPELIIEGRIATFDGEAGFGWIEALAVADGRVLAAGRLAHVAGLAGPSTRRLRLGPGRVAMPAITDAHIHLLEAAVTAEEIDLEGTDSMVEAVAIVASTHAERLAAGDRDGWLLGHGWLADRWGGLPNADALEAAAPGRPIALWAHDHHARWLSRAALAACGIDADTPDPAGGIVGRSDDGRPSGVLFEHATRIGVAAIPRPSPAELAEAVVRHAARLAALGIVGVQDPGATAPDPQLDHGLLVCRGLAVAGRLPLRVHAGIRDEQLETAIAAGLRSGDRVAPDAAHDPAARRAADRFRVGWLKLFGDGSVGSRTAALLEPYEAEAGRPPPGGPRGRLLESRERMTERVAAAAAAGIATMIHAIGDAAVRTALDAFAAIAPPTLAGLPFRPRIEHAQLVHPDDIGRFAQLGVVASVQPVQLRSDEATMRRAWGERTRYAYALASLQAAGADVAFGTDAPVEPADPWPGIAIAVTRLATEWGTHAAPSTPSEAISLERSLRAATAGPRRSAGERDGGRLVVGASADLIVLDAAALDEPVRPGGALASARPLLTLLDGEERFRDPAFDA